MSYQCEIIERPVQPALSVRRTVPVQELPQAFGQAFGQIAQYLQECGEAPAGPPFTAYFNMDMQALEIEIGMPVGRTLPGKGEIQFGQMPSGKFGACLHVGPYPDIGAAYEALSAYLQGQGYQPSGVSYEIYLNSPTDTPPQELRTQILFPLKG
ncbi:MAG: GyrI-like domain-containing protein [Omnitrophica WOR_2 bacterium]